MKKITTLFLLLATAVGLYAQTADDALSLTEERYEGTARSMAMGNAFTALGGDLGGLGINPAASGVFRYSQFTFTPSFTGTFASAGYLGNSQNTRNVGLTVSNAGAVISFDTGNYTGLLNYNFGFVYNKKNSFRSKMAVSGSTDKSSMLGAYASRLNLFNADKGWSHDISQDALDFPSAYSTYSEFFWPDILAWRAYALAPYYTDSEETNYIYIGSTENEEGGRIYTGGLLNQYFNRRTYGSVEEFSFNFGGNFNDILYFGANINVETLSRTVEEYYEEKARNHSDFQDGFVSMDNSYWLRTSGAGANIKLGVIVTPVAGLRLGATVTTPTWYSLTDRWDYTMNTEFYSTEDQKYKSYTEQTPTGSYSYKMKSPMRWSVGVAYAFWDRAIVSVDYERVDYSKIRYNTERGNEGDFVEVNREIRDSFLASNIVRAGAEVRVSRLISLRGGYQYYSPSSLYGASTRVYSAGIGFNIGERAAIDLAWNRTSNHIDEFQLYGDYLAYDNDDAWVVVAPTGTNRHRMSHVACTFSFKF